MELNGFDVGSKQLIVIYDIWCKIWCHWCRFKPGFKVTVHRSTMPQINMILHAVTFYWHQAKSVLC